jgi:hypothetical protein
MRRLMNVLAVLLLGGQIIASAYAQQPSPKGTEVPGLRKPEGKSTEDRDLQRKVKRKAAAPESQKPKAGELRKPEGKSMEDRDLQRKVKKKTTPETQKPKAGELRKPEGKSMEESGVSVEQKRR